MTKKKNASELLKAWLLARSANPYPTPTEKDELMVQTGLSRSQLDHWFTNARQRYVKPKSRRGPNPNYSRYPQKVTKVLVEWLTNPSNVDHPYPSVEDQQELMEKTKLTKKQLQNWFTNARKRRLASRVLNQGKRSSQGEVDQLREITTGLKRKPSRKNLDLGLTKSNSTVVKKMKLDDRQDSFDVLKSMDQLTAVNQSKQTNSSFPLQDLSSWKGVNLAVQLPQITKNNMNLFVQGGGFNTSFPLSPLSPTSLGSPTSFTAASNLPLLLKSCLSNLNLPSLPSPVKNSITSAEALTSQLWQMPAV
mmetsp:Transcript_16900/g.22114  ORF Transcript_16900/g.22114 Transcript_16900/m.22114 type:complete len:306 (-) Transcript_16900:167-1084(-)